MIDDAQKRLLATGALGAASVLLFLVAILLDLRARVPPMRSGAPSRAWLACSSAAALMAAEPALAFNLLEKDDPTVDKGNAAFAAGKYEDALKAYEAAAIEQPDNAELQFDQGNALFKLGRFDDAKDAFDRALGATSQPLKARDYYSWQRHG